MKSVRSAVACAAAGIVFVWLLAACSASAREKTISTTLAATDAASASYVTYDLAHQRELVAATHDAASAHAAVEAWRVNQLAIVTALSATYQAIAAAATVNDDPSVASMAKAAGLLAQTLHDLGVTK